MSRTLATFAAVACVLGGTAAAPAAVYHEAVLADGPVGYWRMNETYAGGAGLIGPIYNYATGSPVIEDTDRGYYDFGDAAGSDIGAAGPRPPVYAGFESDNYAPWFDGTNDLVYINNKAAYQITGPLTLEAWVNPDLMKEQSIIGKFQMNTNQRSYLMQVLSSGKPRFIVNSTGQYAGNVELDSTATIPVGQWSHLAMTFSPSGLNNFMRIYVNGVLRGELTTGVPAAIHANTTAVRIGYHYGTSNAAFFDGRMDEVAIYNAALSPERIAAHVLEALRAPDEALRLPGSGVLHYPLDETAGTVAADLSGHGNTGTLLGTGFSFAGSSAPGMFGTALRFNGTSDYVSVADGGNLPAPGSPFTLAFWARAGNWDDQDALIAAYNRNNLQFSIGLHNASNGLLVGAQSPSISLDQWLIDLGPAGLNLTDSEFAHFAFVFGSDGGIDGLYVNGQPVGTAFNNSWLFNDSGTFTLGRRVRSGDGSYFFAGALDDFAILDRALSPAQVNAVMLFGAYAFMVPEPSAVVLLALGVLPVLGVAIRRARRR